MLLLLSLLLSGCATQQKKAEFWGSFTPEKTFSYDRRYYAVQTVEDSRIAVTVYLTETGEKVDSFSPARALDFWGLCWEKDSYAIWTQSADIGTICYAPEDGKWTLRREAVLPDYIITRYDKAYEEHPELWEKMYKSPLE